MKISTTFIKRAGVIAFSLASLLSSGMGGAVHAVPYDPNGTPTAKTPIFNQFTGVPNGVGDESDFVRIKTQAGTNADYVDTLASACAAGSAYTVRTYVHNGADPNFNDTTAVAHNVTVAMNAVLGIKGTIHGFRSAVTSSNAATVTDTAKLNCNGKIVKLELIPASVKTYSKPLGFQGAPDSAVNGTLKIGSRTQGSGDVFACWDDRVIVTYEVKVVEEPAEPPVSLGECKVVELKVEDKRKVSVTKVTPSLTNATVVGHKIDWGDGTTSDKETDSHTYAKDGTYTVTVSVQIKFADGHTEWKTAASCAKQVTFSTNVPPVVTTTTPTPTTLPSTGPGSVAGIFAGVTVAGTLVHRFVLSRRFQ